MTSKKKVATKKPSVAFKDLKTRRDGPKGGLNPQPLPPLKIKYW